MPTWLEHVEKWKDCTRCSLAQQRTNIVLARGTVPCDVLFVGEAPGASEDAMARPFCGPAGHLLDQIIDRALLRVYCGDCLAEFGELVGTRRVDDSTTSGWTCSARFHDGCRLAAPRYALTNLVACFPAEAKARGDTCGSLSEIKACRPRLEEFITIAQPNLIVLVGVLASNYAPTHDSYGRIAGAATLDIVHPAAILRMKLAQKQMAVERCVVQLRNAVEGISR